MAGSDGKGRRLRLPRLGWNLLNREQKRGTNRIKMHNCPAVWKPEHGGARIFPSGCARSNVKEIVIWTFPAFVRCSDAGSEGNEVQPTEGRWVGLFPATPPLFFFLPGFAKPFERGALNEAQFPGD